ncbi:hypothetical protein FRAHR75_510033 [Frankia sp. Hr75.2]|nr:hypothetical protein FRAHR75_510033 [Frankia sp. Hr75.2]
MSVITDRAVDTADVAYPGVVTAAPSRSGSTRHTRRRFLSAFAECGLARVADVAELDLADADLDGRQVGLELDAGEFHDKRLALLRPQWDAFRAWLHAHR